tara:strand:- start:174 stop:362 length:189 start_codon:yes stop_codon:yes gene_type:complete
MSLYKNIIYPTLTYAERQIGLINTKTYNALVLSLNLRDSSIGKIPSRISSEDEQRSMGWFIG